MHVAPPAPPCDRPLRHTTLALAIADTCNMQHHAHMHTHLHAHVCTEDARLLRENIEGVNQLQFQKKISTCRQLYKAATCNERRGKINNKLFTHTMAHLDLYYYIYI